MASELIAYYQAGVNVYFTIRNRTGQIWNGSSFGAYSTPSYSLYPINATQQGTASGVYAADFPSTIPAGVYSIIAYQQLGGSPAETDKVVAEGVFQWNGSAVMPLSDVATSGQLSLYLPVKPSYGVMIPNFPIYFRSSQDHITPFTSGVVSGQIMRNGGSFGPLQSGAFTEKGAGWYTLQSLTSGDLQANTVALLFTCAGISGGSADPVPVAMVLQKVSGVA